MKKTNEIVRRDDPEMTIERIREVRWEVLQCLAYIASRDLDRDILTEVTRRLGVAACTLGTLLESCGVAP